MKLRKRTRRVDYDNEDEEWRELITGPTQRQLPSCWVESDPDF